MDEDEVWHNATTSKSQKGCTNYKNQTNNNKHYHYNQKKKKKSPFTGAGKTGKGGWNRPDPAISTSASTRSSKDDASSNGVEVHTGSDEVADVSSAAAAMTVSSTKPEDFMSRMKKPLDQLLSEEYGEYEPLPPQSTTPPTPPAPTPTPPTDSYSNGALKPNGKAPINVTIQSFGYKYGCPSLKEGGEYSHPLPFLDVRDLDRAPGYVARLSGLAHQCKRVLLREPRNNAEETDTNDDTKKADEEEEAETPAPKSTRNPIRIKAHDLSLEIMSILTQAINIGGYGHASPLQATIFIGSTYGRHRAVVLTETTAQTLRNHLRKNVGNEVTCGVSVKTVHRDVDRHHTDEEAFGYDLKRIEEKEKRRRDRANEKW